MLSYSARNRSTQDHEDAGDYSRGRLRATGTASVPGSAADARQHGRRGDPCLRLARPVHRDRRELQSRGNIRASGATRYTLARWRPRGNLPPSEHRPERCETTARCLREKTRLGSSRYLHHCSTSLRALAFSCSTWPSSRTLRLPFSSTRTWRAPDSRLMTCRRELRQFSSRAFVSASFCSCLRLRKSCSSSAAVLGPDALAAFPAFPALSAFSALPTPAAGSDWGGAGGTVWLMAVDLAPEGQGDCR